ncbi:MAG: hypothetical protein RL189_786 [Pseudomonadota bacterium]
MRCKAGTCSLLLMFFVNMQSGCDSSPKISRDKVQEAWDDYNNPAQLDAGSVVVFNELPPAGSSIRLPWSDIYWPSNLGGIALRWRNGTQTPFSTQRPSEADVRAMSPEQIAALSPAEKYDVLMGRFDFPTVQAELMRTHPAMPQWYGLCHGWASATLNFDEPKAVTVRSASGIEIPFGSSDVKALLAYAQGVVFMPVAKVLGQRCEIDLTSSPQLRNTAACRDTNAGSFHLILTNLVGRQGQTVIADLSNGAEVWNFPISGYSTRELYRQPASVGAAPQAVSEVVVETDVDFIVEIEQPEWNHLGDSRTVATEKNRYQYAVELDSLGRIVGGRWLSEERPDFLWVQEKADFRGYYAAIESIYLNAIGSPSDVVTPPLAQPTPRVTPPPVPTAAPVPTVPPVAAAPAVPTVPPATLPDQPIGPVLTQPLPLPLPSAPVDTPPTPSAPATDPVVVPPTAIDRGAIALNCPVGSFAVSAPVSFCTDGFKAFAPHTQAMLQECQRRSLPGCFDSLWPTDVYVALRGNDACPLGSSYDQQWGACLEGTTVLGPFSAEFSEKCLSAGFGNMCFAMKMDLMYFSLVNIRR